MKGVIYFLLRFGLTWLGLSFLYSSVFIHKYDTAEPPVTDPITRYIVHQTATAAELFGYEVEILYDHHLTYPTEDEQTMDSLYFNDTYAVSVEEGCNAISNAIIFLAFIIGFGGRWKALIWFIPMGLAFIHVANITRILLLGVLNVDYGGEGFHFFHKYLFTAFLYGAIFILWVWWVNKYGGTVKTEEDETTA
ncbi:exosortase family protein XrtF [Phaeocystidibacter luteus]|uniref:Exosortase family protein XrtF n=1 Tax=Phaeocystidibacter luteus TaxID=911197 RepID=A0A6N6RLQ3_9FLAO|nr:exosortase family protein XrtF [Phaeocystidibacter luteus]KAB2814506.1 exosortase family protein XrtF [Phaeocystidibacter luteus]